MKKNGASVWLAVSVFMFIAVGSALAEKSWDEKYAESDAKSEMYADEEMAAVEMGGFVTGTLLAVNPSMGNFSLKDNSFDENFYRFEANNNTTFEGCSSLVDLKGGDEITVEYFTLLGKHTAENVILEKRYYPEETYTHVEKAMVSE